MRSQEIEIRTGSSEVVWDITGECRTFAERTMNTALSLRDESDRVLDGDGDGLLHVWVPHATAGLAIIETGAGSDDDLLAALRRLLPGNAGWRHRHGSPGHGRDHVLPALLPPYATIPVLGGELALGTWQSICLVDTNVDNAVRRVRLSFLEGA
jgi:secondary thiamine-phosphate synthase enzyme